MVHVGRWGGEGERNKEEGKLVAEARKAKIQKSRVRQLCPVIEGMMVSGRA